MTIIEQIEVQITANLSRLNRDLATARRATTVATNQMRNEWRVVSSSIRSTSTALSGLAVVAVGGFSAAVIKDLGNTIDVWNLVNSRIRLVTDSVEDLKEKQAELFEISQSSRVGYEATAALYTRMARNTRSVHIEASKLLEVTEAISKALIISGANANSADAALVQLTQGFAANALRGQELNSVMEQIPRVSEAIASGMGVTIGRLRTLAAEGKLTTQVVVDAIASQADVINQEFETMQRTMGQAALQSKNQWAKFMGALDKSLLITKNVNSIFDELTESLKDQDKEVEGIQNSWVTAAKTISVWVGWMADQAILAYATLTSVWHGIGPFFTMIWAEAKLVTDDFFTDLLLSGSATMTSLKLSFYEAINSLSSISVFGTQITPEHIISSETLDKLRADIAETERMKVTFHNQYLDSMKEASKEFNRAVEDDNYFLEAATNRALVTIKDRYAAIETEAVKYRKQQEAAAAAYKKPPTIYDVGLSEVERAAVQKQITAYNKLLVTMKSRANIADELARIENRGLGVVEREALAREVVTQRVEAHLELVRKLNAEYAKLIPGASERQRTTIEAAVKSLQAEVLRDKIALERADIRYDIALRKQLDSEKAISKELLKQSRYAYEIREARDVTLLPKPIADSRAADIVEATERVRIAQEYAAGLRQLEDTDTNRLRIAKAQTTVLKEQAALVKKQAKEQAELYERLYSTLDSFAVDLLKTFGDTSDLIDSLESSLKNVFNSQLNNALSGAYGPQAQVGAAGFEIIRGIFNTTASEIAAQIEEATGTVDFNDASLTALGGLYSRSISPVYTLINTTNTLLREVDNSIKASVATADKSGFLYDGSTPDRTFSITGADFKEEHDRFLAGLSSSSRELVSSGIRINEQSLLNRQMQLDVEGYQAVKITNERLWGALSDSRVSRATRELDEDLSRSFNDIRADLVESLRLAGKMLEVDASELERQLRGVRIEQTTIELKDLTPEEAAARINEAWASIMTATVKDLDIFADLVSTFSRGSEKELETLLRISRDYEIAAGAVASTDITLPDVIIPPEATAAYNGLKESLARAENQLQRDFYTQAIANVEITRQEVLIRLAEQAGGGDELAGLTSAYVREFFSAEEQARKSLDSVKAALAESGIDLPKTKEAYRALVEASDLSTDADRERYLLLLRLAPMYAQATDALAALGEAAEDAGESSSKAAKAAKDAAEEAERVRDKYNGLMREALSGSFSPYSSEEQIPLLNQLASNGGSTADQLASLKAATQAAFNSSPTFEAYIAKFNSYVEAIQGNESADLDDIYAKMNEIIEKMDDQIQAQESASYQEAL